MLELQRRISILPTRFATACTVGMLLFVPLLSFAQGSRQVAFNSATLPSDVFIGRIAGAVQLTGGTLVVADDVERKLHFFSSSGRYQRSVGRSGKGPGEFTGLHWVGECAPDTVSVFDQTQARVSVFTSSGEYVRTSTPVAATVALMDCARDGTTVTALPGKDAVQNLTGTIVLTRRDAEILTVRGTLLDEGKPLGASLRIAVAPGRVYFGAGDTPVITQRTFTGSRTISVGGAARVPTAANKKAAIEELATKFPGSERDYARMRRMLAAMPIAERLPYFRGLFVDAETNNLWVLVSAPGDTATVLRELGESGRSLREIRLPAGVRVYQVRAGRVIGKEVDEASGEEMLFYYRGR